jgi:hypothetical protein
MKFKRFVDFLKERGVSEDHQQHAKEPAMEYDAKMLTLRHRFPDMSISQILDIVKAAGHDSIPAFLHDKNDDKWSGIQIPGQKNYIKPKNQLYKPQESE